MTDRPDFRPGQRWRNGFGFRMVIERVYVESRILRYRFDEPGLESSSHDRDISNTSTWTFIAEEN